MYSQDVNAQVAIERAAERVQAVQDCSLSNKPRPANQAWLSADLTGHRRAEPWAGVAGVAIIIVLVRLLWGRWDRA